MISKPCNDCRNYIEIGIEGQHKGMVSSFIKKCLVTQEYIKGEVLVCNKQDRIMSVKAPQTFINEVVAEQKEKDPVKTAIKEFKTKQKTKVEEVAVAKEESDAE